MRRRRQSESGFALLMVLVAAAVIAVMLYREMPRVYFEGQRAREELLIARGEQYYRAIQLYTRRMRTYPPSIEALENTNNIRFLRRRYKDPMTGTDDWRLIHAGPGGVFPDSVTQKAAKIKGVKTVDDASDATSADAATDPNAPSGATAKTRKRASDTAAYGSAGTMAGDTYAITSGTETTTPAETQYPLGSQEQAAATEGQTEPAQFGAQPGEASAAGSLGVSGGLAQPGMQSEPSASASPVTPGAANNAALAAIQNQLTGPARTGITPTSGQMLGAGIAGVASKYKGESIRVYKEKSKYQEWEFLYDPRTDYTTGAGRGGPAQTGLQNSPARDSRSTMQ
jgi:type II secretory pathway pseudopilin PulG